MKLINLITDGKGVQMFKAFNILRSPDYAVLITVIILSVMVSISCSTGGDRDDASEEELVFQEEKIWYLDADYDGYGDKHNSISAEEQPDGYVGNDADCDDTNHSIHIDANEVCGDGKDNNCDGKRFCSDSECADDDVCSNCIDRDSDGYFTESVCGTKVDCDDNDPNIHPDAEETANDGTDQNCDGGDNTTSTDISLTGNITYSQPSINLMKTAYVLVAKVIYPNPLSHHNLSNIISFTKIRHSGLPFNIDLSGTGLKAGDEIIVIGLLDRDNASWFPSITPGDGIGFHFKANALTPFHQLQVFSFHFYNLKERHHHATFLFAHVHTFYL